MIATKKENNDNFLLTVSKLILEKTVLEKTDFPRFLKYEYENAPGKNTKKKKKKTIKEKMQIIINISNKYYCY